MVYIYQKKILYIILIEREREREYIDFYEIFIKVQFYSE